MGKSTISMVIFHRYVSHYQRVVHTNHSHRHGGATFARPSWECVEASNHFLCLVGSLQNAYHAALREMLTKYVSLSEYKPWNAMAGITQSKACFHGISLSLSFSLNEFFWEIQWKHNGPDIWKCWSCHQVGNFSRSQRAQLPSRDLKWKSDWWFQLSVGRWTGDRVKSLCLASRRFHMSFLVLPCEDVYFSFILVSFARVFPWIHSRSYSL